MLSAGVAVETSQPSDMLGIIVVRHLQKRANVVGDLAGAKRGRWRNQRAVFWKSALGSSLL